MSKHVTSESKTTRGKTPSLLLFEPSIKQKGRRLAALVRNQVESRSEEDIKRHLKQIRSYTTDNINSLAEEFIRTVSKNRDTNVMLAKDASDAVDYISNLTPDTRTIYVSRSSTVSELRPNLEKVGYTLVDTYSSQFLQVNNAQKVLSYPWQLPTLFEQSAWHTFDCVGDVAEHPIADVILKNVVALLSVNATSAQDGTLCFLQHSSNIGTILKHASKIFVLVGMEKIVQNRDDAVFQTKAIGMFGMRSIILDLEVGETNPQAIENLAEIPEIPDLQRELHIILLDNHRTRIANSYYKELLCCIGCRACAIQCPGYRYVEEFANYPKEYLWLFLLGYNTTIEWCIHCAMCDFQCPVGINLSKLMAYAKNDYSPQVAHSRVNQVLINIPKLMPIGSLIAVLVNIISKVRLIRVFMERILGIDRRRILPTFHYNTFERWLRSHHA